MGNRRQLGAAGETAAAAFLRRQRYSILERNYRCPLGEIDIIALDRSAVVFVEVKARHGEGSGTPLDAVDKRKQHRLTRVAMHYLTRHRLHDRDARFDVVGVWEDAGELRCELIRNAFGVA